MANWLIFFFSSRSDFLHIKKIMQPALVSLTLIYRVNIPNLNSVYTQERAGEYE